MKSTSTFICIFMIVVSFSFSYQTTKNLNIPAEGIKEFRIECGAGLLKVIGQETLNEIQVEAEIKLKGRSEDKAEEFMNRRLELSLEKHGQKAVLISQFKNRFPRISFKTQIINLTVLVPARLNLDIEDGSGSMTISDIKGNVDIDDGAGELEITNIQGNVRIDDGSGDIDITDIKGSVWVDDGSGTLNISHVGQSVFIDDGSGSIYIDDVEGDVTIEDDGSGKLHVKNVKGRVRK